MTRRARTHYADRVSADGLTIALCRQLTPSATRDHDAVTCRVCLRMLAAVPFAPAELVEAEPWTPPLPKTATLGARDLSPEDERAIRESIAGERQRPVFGSLGQALEALCTVLVDGYASGSAAGSCEALGTMGTMIQTGARGSSTTTRQAESVAEVSIALRCAFSTWRDDHAASRHLSLLSTGEAVSAYLCMVVGLPMTDKSERSAGGDRVFKPKRGLRAWSPVSEGDVLEAYGLKVGGLKKWANRRVLVEMWARGLLAIPARPETTANADDDDRRMSRYVRDLDAVAVRRGELELRRAG